MNKVIQYKSCDGELFNSEEECNKHENRLQRNAQKLKYYQVVYNPDTTEGRGYYGLCFFCVGFDCNDGVMKDAYFSDYCYKRFGEKITFVMGVSPILSWWSDSLTREQIAKKIKDKEFVKCGDYKYPGKTEYIFIKEDSSYQILKSEGELLKLLIAREK
jgi:hypothetical protein